MRRGTERSWPSQGATLHALQTQLRRFRYNHPGTAHTSGMGQHRWSLLTHEPSLFLPSAKQGADSRSPHSSSTGKAGLLLREHQCLRRGAPWKRSGSQGVHLSWLQRQDPTANLKDSLGHPRAESPAAAPALAACLLGQRFQNLLSSLDSSAPPLPQSLCSPCGSSGHGRKATGPCLAPSPLLGIQTPALASLPSPSSSVETAMALAPVIPLS